MILNLKYSTEAFARTRILGRFPSYMYLNSMLYILPYSLAIYAMNSGSLSILIILAFPFLLIGCLSRHMTRWVTTEKSISICSASVLYSSMTSKGPKATFVLQNICHKIHNSGMVVLIWNF